MRNTNFITCILIIFLDLLTFCVFSITDTTYKKKQYNFVEYYSDKKVRSFGNMKDTVKTGEWIYFKQDGKTMAKGSYLNGRKIGKWTYFDLKNKKHTHTWDCGAQPEEKLIFENGQLIMYDNLNTKDASGYILLNFKFGILQYYILN